VGTKSVVARLVGRHSTIGIDLVAMNVDDVAAAGAEPLFLLDYLSVGRLDERLVDELVAGVAAGCRQAGCALLGGEMSEHPDVLAPGDYDLVGFAVGVVERSASSGWPAPGCGATATPWPAAPCSTGPGAASTSPRGAARTTASARSC
jgi:phosphoribosylformylglycinamidine cyclo-ligase